MTQTATELRFASAVSALENTTDALREITQSLVGQLTAPVDLAIAFVSSHHRAQFDLIHQTLSATINPRVELAVTAEGVIGIGKELERCPGISVLAASLPDAHLEPFRYAQIDWLSVLDQPDSLRQQIGVGNGPISALLLLADPFSTPIARLLSLFNQAFPNVPVIGGMASGGQQPNENRLMLSGQVTSEGAIGLAISGPVAVHTTVSQGCRAIGRPLVITKSQRHVVQQLAGRNALEVVQEIASETTEEDQKLIQSEGLLIGRVIDEYKPRFGRGDFLIRAIVGVDRERGYIAIGDSQVRVGQTVQLHVRDRRTAAEDFQLLLDLQKLHGPAAGALLFSCNGRGTRLFEEPDTDASLVRKALGDIPLAGCFAAGEIGSVGGKSFLHAHTASLMVFRPQGPQASSDLPSA
ncbi:MAG: FIST C-terminal domain-containing protein [Phycisphaeraceae bacterium]|nr:FIST C-terminal domain-containing protein [Phycisphaeraceae bacterium]